MSMRAVIVLAVPASLAAAFVVGGGRTSIGSGQEAELPVLVSPTAHSTGAGSDRPEPQDRGLSSSLAESKVILARRPVRPMPLTTCEQFWLDVQPIFDMLPHMEKWDIHKLPYFCPADFNKDDRVDEQDLALFAQTWNDQDSPLFNWCDLNGDGFVDAADAVEFMHRFDHGRRDGEQLKEARSTIC
jgi:hypothetical protein